MSIKVNIYDVDHNMDLYTICRMINQNFHRIVANVSTTVETVSKDTTMDHSQLTHREDFNQHPMKAITGLQDLLGTIQSSISSLQSDISTLTSRVNTLNTKVTALQTRMTDAETGLEDHEKRIKKLEGK